MKTFVFEWLSEELPFKVQNFLHTEVKNLFTGELQKADILYSNISVFTTPRRFAVYVTDVHFSGNIGYIKGPKEGSSDEILNQFLNRVNKKREELCVKKISDRNYYCVQESKDISLCHALKLAIENLLPKINWPKSMCWGRYAIKCNRPIISFLALLGEEIVGIEFSHFKASNKTLGHRFLSKGEIIVPNAESYINLLAENFVVLNHDKRKNKIRASISDVLKEKAFALEIDELLLDEVNALVEYHDLVIGSIPQSFIKSLPQELIKVVMKNHQRFFSCFYKDGSMADIFIAVSNMPSNPGMIKGYERVLNARLSDASLLMESDKKHTIEDFLSKLKEITFHTKLGNMQYKVDRISTLAKYIALWVNGASMINVEKAAMFSKIDLATSVVSEFPELEGIMSAYHYTLAHGKTEIADIIKEHTYPVDASSPCTHVPAAAAIAIADKMDSLVGFIIAGESVNSVKDPFGIRRNAIGIIRTVFENNINLPLKLIIEKSVSLFPSKLFGSKIIDKIKGSTKLTRSDVSKKILEYFLDRIYVFLKNEGIRIEFLKNIKLNHHPLELRNNAKFVKEFLCTDEGESFIAAYRRLSNILHKTDLLPTTKKFNKKLVQNEHEVALLKSFSKIEHDILKFSRKNNIIEVVRNLSTIAPYLENFMNNVTVNSNDTVQKLNRLILLNRIRTLCNKAINFELIIKNK